MTVTPARLLIEHATTDDNWYVRRMAVHALPTGRPDEYTHTAVDLDLRRLTLVLILAIWAIAFGVLELFAAFGAGETAGTHAWFVVAGLVSIAFGVVLASRPDVGAISLAVIYGIFSLAFGTTQIVLGVQARRATVAGTDRLAPA